MTATEFTRSQRRGFLKHLLGSAAAAFAVLAAGSFLVQAAGSKTCRTCGGSGQVLRSCAICGGSGKSDTGNTCHGCGGTGKRYRFCRACDGRGTIGRCSCDGDGCCTDENVSFAQGVCGLKCIEGDGGYCNRPKHHRGFHHCTKGHSF